MTNKVIITKRIGQEWQKCPFEWGLEDYVVTNTKDAGKLILMYVDEDIDTCERLYTPVLSIELNVYAGDK